MFLIYSCLIPVSRFKFAFACFPFFILILSYSHTAAQSNYSIPAIIQPSPQSMAFTKYGDYPMTGCNGLTDITIPLHTITGRKLSLPITMSFHASGRMANEANGVLGIRWTLNCGGLVTRTMKGIPDEYNLQEPYVVNPLTSPSFDDLYSACTDGKIDFSSFYKPLYDSEFDIFDYVLPNGKQGHFILKNENGQKVPMIFPLEPLKIELFKDASLQGYYQYINITDVDGTKYIFGNLNTASDNAIEREQTSEVLDFTLSGAPTAWYLAKIISSDGSDEISLSYEKRRVVSVSSSQTANIEDRIRNSTVLFLATSDDPYELYLRDRLYPYYFEQTIPVVNSLSKTTVPTLRSIQFSGGAASINYTTIPELYINNMFVNEIVINGESGVEKRIKFDCVKNFLEKELYYLQNLRFYGVDTTVVGEKYSFTYYEPNTASDTYDFMNSAIHKDWWGGYSPSVSNILPHDSVSLSPNALPGMSPLSKEIGFYDSRNTNEQGKKIGMLKSITYPTGGETEFVYESNRYDYLPTYQPPANVATEEGPGLRIKEIISRPVQGKNIRKLYKYGAYEDGRGFISEYLRPGTLARRPLMNTESTVMHFWEWINIPGSPQFPGEAGCRSRNFLSDPYVLSDFQGSLVKYDVVNEYYIEDDAPKYKTQSGYSWALYYHQFHDFTIHDYEEPIGYMRMFADPQDAWEPPVLAGKNFYKYVNGVNELVKSESYWYDTFNGGEAWDMPTYLHTNFVFRRVTTAADQYALYKDYHSTRCNVYGYGFRNYKSRNQLLVGITTEEHNLNGVVKTDKTITYDPANCLVKNERVINSKGDTLRTTFSYPMDFVSQPVYQRMVQMHILSPVVETISSSNSIETRRMLTNYAEPFSNVFTPQSVEIKNAGQMQEIVANFNKYDNQSHILEQQRASDVKEVYFWGYKGRYPVVKIVGNKTFDEIRLLASVDTALLNNGTIAGIKSELERIAGILRTQPQLFINTYTYKPMVGMTSETDANNKTIYYEYDVLGRLKLVRDQDQNILKRLCYNYAGQSEPCKLFFNEAKSQVFTRSNCEPGFTGGAYTYIVPQGRFGGFTQGEADAFANADIAANGQHWADSLGTCSGTTYASPDVSGYYTAASCQYGELALPFYVYMPAGSYISTISVQDAYEQAQAAAQYSANLYGCQGAVGYKILNNLPVAVTLVFTKQNSSEEYIFYMDPTDGNMITAGFLPEGVYTVELYPDYYPYYYDYSFGDWPPFHETGNITIQNVLVSSSRNYFTIE